MSLETVSMPAVEILAADVTIHGRGSPPKGDRFSVSDLRAIADANRELAEEIRVPAKIGHSLAGSAVGHLENIRVAGDKLVADIHDVPKRFAELVDARAYSGRSIELARATSQRTGKKYDNVVAALAWLGDRLPAVQTLADVQALYEADVEVVRAYELSSAPRGSEAISEALAFSLITPRQAEILHRSYETAPAEVEALVESLGLGEIRALEAWFTRP